MNLELGKNKLISFILSAVIATTTVSLYRNKDNYNKKISNEITINETLDKTADLTNIDDIVDNLFIDRTNSNDTITLDEAICKYENARMNKDMYYCNTYSGYIGKILLCSLVLDKLNINPTDLISFDFNSTNCTIMYYKTVTNTVSGNIKITDRVEEVKRVNFSSGFTNRIADAAYMAYCHNYHNLYSFDELYKSYIKLLTSRESKKTENDSKKLKLILDEEKYARINK